MSGPARADGMTPARRKEMARKAAAKRDENTGGKPIDTGRRRNGVGNRDTKISESSA